MVTAAATLTGNSGAASGQGAGAGGNGGSGGAASGLPASANSGWFDTVKDAGVKTWLGSKNFPDAETALKSYHNLEQLMGADKAGRTVMLPKDDNDADGWAAFTKRLGVPDSPDGYKLPMPDGVDDGFAKTAATWFQKAGVPPRAANQIAEAWNGWVQEQVRTGEEADRAESEKQMTALEKEWGNKFTENRELAQRGYREFAKQFGLDDKAALERAESVLGAANLTRFFAGLGSLNAESAFAGSDKGGTFGVTPAEAQKQIEKIRSDRIAGNISDHQWRTTYEKEVLRLGQIVASAMKS